MVKPNVSLDPEFVIPGQDEGRGKIVEPLCVNGYDGLSGAHDNLVWNPLTGMITYTLYNKVIHENSKTRQQVCHTVSDVRLSCLAVSHDGKYAAVGEGETNSKGQSLIMMIKLEEKARVKQLNYF